MSGPFGSSQWMYSSASGFYSHTIDQSLRFENAVSANLSRTPSSASNRRTWTWSGWLKLGELDTGKVPFSAYSGSVDYFNIQLKSDNTLQVLDRVSGNYAYLFNSNQVFRDASAWYHLVVATDTTQSTEANRVKIYLNGEQITSWSTATYPSQNYDTYVNTTNSHILGQRGNSSNYFDGYLAEVNFVDGSALTPTSFGETKAGIWIPKDTSSLTFGTNGFRLKFQDSSAIGDDTSGNGNDFTASGFATNDVMPDSPTNNFCTYNPLERNVSGQSYQFIARGNLNVGDYVSTDALLTLAGTMAMRSGKWYFEILRTAAVNGGYWGIIREDKFAGQNSIGTTGTSSGDYAYYVQFNGSLITNGSTTSSFTTAFSTDDIIQVAYDADTGKVWFGRNNTWGGSGDPANGTNAAATVDSYSDYGYKVYTAVIGSASSYEQATLNCGQDSSFAGEITAGGNADANGIGDFKYAPPSGFLALCTANLPNPGIDPAQDEEPADYFNTVLYTGNGTSASDTQAISGVGFSPDFTWIKNRTDAASHILNDRVRGAGKNLFSHSDTTENVGGSTGDLFTSFDSDGFTVNYEYGGGTNNSANQNAKAYVAWNWLAGGSAVTNNDGSVASSVSANTEAGFSIVTHDNGSGTRTVGHGLDSTPELIIEKKRDSTGDWLVQTTLIDGSNDYLRLNTTAAKANGVGASPTATVFSPNVGGGADCLAYCFHSVDGYSKIGTYTGNGSSDGPFVYTGFRVAWLLNKSVTNTSQWALLDAARDVGNPTTQQLFANLSNAEGTSSGGYDFLSNGFKIRDNGFNNTSGQTYIYLAFAEQPFKYSNAR